ncbi:sodium/potassium/calcium exchanger 6, mitochondrial-like, partial [Orbicella faveolata]|uniref:sodium/potassium/calcium exchanger 6, mitochondrial-like n=1 Tax=Orbicella faveolata TaxID=48498 RepID=UPI0009E1ACF2
LFPCSFCPSLQVISKTLRLSQNIAGVTFLAIGNGAPDIFSSLAAFSNSRDPNEVQLGMQALFGAGMFVTTVVVGVVSFVSTVTLKTRPFTRDVLFYLGAVSWTFITLYKENITLEEAIGFIVFYVAYIFVVIVGHYIHQRCKRKVRVEITPESSESGQSESTGDYFESEGQVRARNLLNAVRGISAESIISVIEEPTDIEHQDTRTHGPHNRVSDALFATEKTLIAPAIHSAPIPARQESVLSDEELPLLGSRRQVSACGKFLQGLEPIDREDWCRSNYFWRFFLIVKAPAVFCLNLTVPVVDYDKEQHNWNKWLNVLHCITMPVFSVMVTKASNFMVGGRFPAWALALCGGIVLALVIAMTTRSDKQPWGHFLFAYVAFAISVIWIYTTANEIVNLLQTFGFAFGLSNAILGLTFLAWGNSLGDLISNTAMARQGFSRMAVSACFGGPLLNMLLGIGLSCTVGTVTRGHAISLRHRFHQYQISAGFLAASLSSSAIIIPLMGFKVPRMYGVYLIVLYVAYLVVSIAAEIKHI